MALAEVTTDLAAGKPNSQPSLSLGPIGICVNDHSLPLKSLSLSFWNPLSLLSLLPLLPSIPRQRPTLACPVGLVSPPPVGTPGENRLDNCSEDISLSGIAGSKNRNLL